MLSDQPLGNVAVLLGAVIHLGSHIEPLPVFFGHDLSDGVGSAIGQTLNCNSLLGIYSKGCSELAVLFGPAQVLGTADLAQQVVIVHPGCAALIDICGGEIQSDPEVEGLAHFSRRGVDQLLADLQIAQLQFRAGDHGIGKHNRILFSHGAGSGVALAGSTLIHLGGNGEPLPVFFGHDLFQRIGSTQRDAVNGHFFVCIQCEGGSQLLLTGDFPSQLLGAFQLSHQVFLSHPGKIVAHHRRGGQIQLQLKIESLAHLSRGGVDQLLADLQRACIPAVGDFTGFQLAGNGFIARKSLSFHKVKLLSIGDVDGDLALCIGDVAADQQVLSLCLAVQIESNTAQGIAGLLIHLSDLQNRNLLQYIDGGFGVYGSNVVTIACQVLRGLTGICILGGLCLKVTNIIHRLLAADGQLDILAILCADPGQGDGIQTVYSFQRVHRTQGEALGLVAAFDRQGQGIIVIDGTVHIHQQRHSALIATKHSICQGDGILGDHDLTGAFTGQAQQILINTADVGGSGIVGDIHIVRGIIGIGYLQVGVIDGQLRPIGKIIGVLIGIGSAEIETVGIVPDGSLGGRHQLRTGQSADSNRILAVGGGQVGIDLLLQGRQIIQIRHGVAQDRTDLPGIHRAVYS